MVEVGQVEVGQDSFDWRSTRYLAKTVEVGLVEVGQHKQRTQTCFTLSSIENILLCSIEDLVTPLSKINDSKCPLWQLYYCVETTKNLRVGKNTH